MTVLLPPIREVILTGRNTGPLSVMATPVTQELYSAVTGENPAYFAGPGHEQWPIESVNYNDILSFAERLSKILGLAEEGRMFRLPAEEEWLWFATCDGSWKPSEGHEDRYCHFSADSPVDVGAREPNPWGLWDTHGMVHEWTSGQLGSYRVIRGGSWDSSAAYARAAYRGNDGPGNRANDLGFRLVRSI